MDDINPIFSRGVTPYVGSDPTPPSTYSEQPKPRSVSPIVAEIIGKLGLRYRPSNQTDLEAHAEALRLLAEDVADIPPRYLDAAAKCWVRDSKFMPRASELIELSRQLAKQDMAGSDAAGDQLQAHCDRLNAMNNGRDGWHVVGKSPNRTVAKARDGIGRAA